MTNTVLGVKHDQDKLEIGSLFSYIPAENFRELVVTLKRGAAVHGNHNWQNGLGYMQCLNAAARHLTAYIAGEQRDAENLHHLANAMAELLFVIHFERTGTGLDDRIPPFVARSMDNDAQD